jgi:membrane complex biogenesis BtpA family protein
MSLANLVSFTERGLMLGSLPKLIAVIHLPALPGSPCWQGQEMESIIESARQDYRALVEAGFDGLIVENFGDAPFYKTDVPPITLTAMTRVIAAIDEGAVTLGVNVLRNDAKGALAVAAATGAGFIRVNVHTGAMLTDQGIIEGQAAETMRLRKAWSPKTHVLADVAVKHAQSLAPMDLVQVAKDTFHRGLADGLIVTGKGTGEGASLEDVRLIKEFMPAAPVFVGSGVDQANVASTLQVCDGVIVGTALKVDGVVKHPVDSERAKRFVESAKAVT